MGMNRHKHSISWDSVFQVCLSPEKKPEEGERPAFLLSTDARELGTDGSELGAPLTVQGQQMGFQGTGTVPRHVQKSPAQTSVKEARQVLTPPSPSAHIRGVYDQGPGLHRAQTPGISCISTVTPNLRQHTYIQGMSPVRLLFSLLCRWRTQSSFRSYSLGQGHRASWWWSWDQFLILYSQVPAWTRERYPVLGRKNNDNDGDDN